jgi:SET domain-containing protein
MRYAGERISWPEANRRYERAGRQGHTFYFDLGDGHVLDGGAEGNSARWINHGCSPNVEATQVGTRIELHALRTIRAGQELLLDYQLVLDEAWLEAELYTCRCDSSACRGTMLAG